jgi:hypothetical protein
MIGRRSGVDDFSNFSRFWYRRGANASCGYWIVKKRMEGDGCFDRYKLAIDG